MSIKSYNVPNDNVVHYRVYDENDELIERGDIEEGTYYIFNEETQRMERVKLIELVKLMERVKKP